MKTIELSAALASAPVQENLKNFAGLDAQNALGLMTPERLAAVAGGLINEIKISSTTSNPIEVAKEVLATLPAKYTTFRVLHSFAGTRLVDGYIYDTRDYGIFRITNIDGKTTVVKLYEGNFYIVS